MNQISIIQAECFKSHPPVGFGMSTMRGGVSPQPLGLNLSFSVGDAEANVRKNRELFFGMLNIGLHELAIPRQIHSNTVRRVEKPGSYADCDALVTNTRRVFLCVSVADCVPVFILDTRQHVVAGIHAGWKGTAERIVERSIQMMEGEFSSNPADMIAFVGPSAGSCCYTVGDEVASRFDNQFVQKTDGKIVVDLKSANVAQLVACGIPKSSVEVSPLCTITESGLLHSFRRDKDRSGRMMGVLGLV